MKSRAILCLVIPVVAFAPAAQAIELYGNAGLQHYQKAVMLGRIGDTEHAIAEDSEAVKATPGYEPAYVHRGMMYWEGQADLQAAMTDFDTAIRLRPNDWFAHYGRGVTFKKMGNNTDALQEFDNAITLDPKGFDTWGMRCETRAIIGRTAEALADCNTSLELRPGMGWPLSRRAYVYMRMGEFQKAIADCDAAFLNFPLSADTFYLRGIAKLNIGDKAGGEADLARLSPQQSASLPGDFPGLTRP